jgi:dihydrofolate synthase/folylpolyglutamate synthase
MEWLGPTISAIAREKAGILRPGGTMITLPQHPEANQVLGEVATELAVRAVSAAPYVPAAGTSGPYTVDVLGASIKVDSPLAGAHQQRNIALAIAAAVELAEHHGIPITPAAIENGIRLTRWPGRLERIQKIARLNKTARIDQNAIDQGKTEWILDVAHNPAGAWALRAAVRGILEAHQPRLLVFSCLRDKPLSEMAQILFPIFDEVIVATIHNPRAAALDDLLAAAAATGTPATSAHSVSDALRLAQDRITQNRVTHNGVTGIAVVSGSVYLVGEARTLLLSGTSE